MKKNERSDSMKEKIFLVIIGVLVGAVLATGVFFTYTLISNSGKCRDHQIGMNGGGPPGMQNGNNNGNNNNSNQPPSMPNGDNNQSNGNGQPPEKPGENNQQNSTQDNNT